MDMKALVICIAILFCVPERFCLGQEGIKCPQRLFVRGNGITKSILFDVQNDELRMMEPRELSTDNGFLVDGCKYYVNWKIIDENHKTYDATKVISIRDDSLFYDSMPVQFPDSVKPRLVWEAVLWKDWVVCLGRTSRTDKEAKMVPPFFATELIVFNSQKRNASIKIVDPNPPMHTELLILDPQ